MEKGLWAEGLHPTEAKRACVLLPAGTPAAVCAGVLRERQEEPRGAACVEGGPAGQQHLEPAQSAGRHPEVPAAVVLRSIAG